MSMMKSNRKWTSAFLCGLLMLAQSVFATSATWTGATDGTWSTGSNWSATPVPGAGDTATFNDAGNGNTTIDIGSGVTLSSLALASGAAAYTFNGSGSLAVTNAITMGAATTQTFNVPFTAPYIQEYNLVNNGAGDLVFNKTYGFSATRRGNFSGTGNIFLNGGTVNTEWCRKLGPNTLNISNNVQFLYEMTFCEGTVNYNATNQNSVSYAYFIVGDQANKKIVFNMNGGLLTRQLNTGTGWAGRYIPMVLGFQTSSTGIVNQAGGVMNILGNTRIGHGTSSVGEYNMSGGTYYNQDDLFVGWGGAGTLGKLTLSGGAIYVGTTATKWVRVADQSTAKGQIDISGGSFNLWNNTCLKLSPSTGTGGGTVNQSGGQVNFYSNSGTTIGGTGNLDLQYAGTAACTNAYHLNGGTLTVPQVISSANTGTRALNFNGGTLQAAVATTAFVTLNTGSVRANVRNGGAIIDTNGKDVTVPQPLLHSAIDGDAATDGGLTKTGSGMLTLTATNTYTGPTVLSAGTLTLTGAGSINNGSGITVNGSGSKLLQISAVASTPAVTLTQGTLDGTNAVGAVTVENGTGGVVVNGNSSVKKLTAASLTFNGAAAVNINTDGSDAGLVVSGALVTTPASGQVTLNVTTGPVIWENGISYKLVKYGSFGGAVTDFTLGTIIGKGARQSASLSNDTVNGYITLNMSGDMPYWTGESSSEWSTSVIADPKNWKLQTAGTAVDFLLNDAVLFDDRVIGSQSVNLTENVSPTSTIFNNATKDYTLASAGGYGIASGTLSKYGAGTVTLKMANTYTGGTTINEGTLQIGDGTTDGSLASGSDIANNANLIYNVASAQTAANAISGAGTLTKTGNGALTLSGSSTLTGPVNLQAGTLNVNNSAALGNTTAGTLAISGGTLDNTSGSDLTLAAARAQTWSGDFAFTGTKSLNFNGGAVTLTNGTQRTVNVAAGTLTIGSLTSTGTGLTKDGAGTLAMGTVPSVIAGPLSLLQGKIQIGLNDLTVTGLTGTGTLENGSGTTRWLYISNASDNTFSGVLQNGAGAGLLGICKNGAGMLTLSATNTYSDRTTVRGGTLSVNYLTNVGIGCNLGTANSLYLGDNTGTATLLYTGPDVTVDRGFTANANGGNSAIVDTANKLTFTAGVGAANAGAFIKRGAGTLTLGNASATQRINNGDIGGTVFGANIANGKLALKNGTFASTGETVVGGQVQTGGLYTQAAMDITDSAIYNVGNWFSIGRGNGTNGLSSVVTVNNGTLNQTIPGSGLAMGMWANVAGFNAKPVLTIRGSGTVNVAGYLHCGETSGSDAQINVQDTATLNVTNATIGIKRVGAGGKGSLNVSGGAVNTLSGLTLAGDANSVGVVNLNGGRLNAAALVKGNGTSATLNFNGGTLQANTNNASFLTGLTAAKVYAGGATLDAQSSAITVAQPLLAVTGNGVTGVSGLSVPTVYTVTPYVTFSAPESGTDAATGYALLNADGTLASIAVSHAGTGYSVAPTVSLNGTPVAATVTIGAMSNGGLTLKGTGTNTLTGASTYAGLTTVNMGTLMLNGSLASGSMSVTNGATLAGVGSAGNAVVTVHTGCTVSAGMSGVGTLTVGGLELKAGARLAVDLPSNGTCDQVVVNGALSLEGLSMSDLVVSASADVPTGTHVIVDATSVSGTLGDTEKIELIPHEKWLTMGVDGASGNLLLTVWGRGTVLYFR